MDCVAENTRASSAKQFVDFLQCIELDVVLHIMSFLDDPADVVRLSAVSRCWRQFVTEKGVLKLMCLKAFPEPSRIGGVVYRGNTIKSSLEAETRNAVNSELFERDDMIYVPLLNAIRKSKVSKKDCLLFPINVPNFAAKITRRPVDRNREAYLLNKPDSLVFRLKTAVSVITEINMQLRKESPILLAKSVRFRMGHLKPRKTVSSSKVKSYSSYPKQFNDKYIWTFTSQEFPMVKQFEQTFRLPDVAMCVGGYVMLELIGREERKEMDELCHS